MKYNTQLDLVNRVLPTGLKVEMDRRLHMGERTEQWPHELFKKFKKKLKPEDFFLYPDTSKLKEKLAKRHNVRPENIFLAPGSDQCIKSVFDVFLEKGKRILMPEYRFPMYDVYADIIGAKIVDIGYDGSNLKTETVEKDEDLRAVIIANPNSPVGDVLTNDQYEELEKLDVPIIVDQAYSAFGGKVFNEAQKIFEGYIFIHSFSKDFGLAGSRIGYVVATEEVIHLLGKVRQMFELTGASIKAALFMLKHEDVIKNPYVNSVKCIQHEVQRIFVDENPRNLGGNWVNIPEEFASCFDGYEFKKGVKLPWLDYPVLRMTACPKILEII